MSENNSTHQRVVTEVSDDAAGSIGVSGGLHASSSSSPLPLSSPITSNNNGNNSLESKNEQHQQDEAKSNSVDDSLPLQKEPSDMKTERQHKVPESVVFLENNNHSSAHGGSSDFDVSRDLTLASASAAARNNNNNGKARHLGIFTGSAILINYISVGYVLLPWGFSQGGTLLSTFVLIFVVFQSYITSIFILESCARANIVDWRHTVAHVIGRGGDGLNTSSHNHLSSSLHGGSTDIFATVTPASSTSRGGGGGGGRTPRHSITSRGGGSRSIVSMLSFDRSILRNVQQRSVELSELCRVFLGPKLKTLFTLTTAFDLYCITWTFSTVFASSLADYAPITDGNNDDSFSNYKIYMLIFAVITIPLSCMTILDQLLLQMAFLAARTLMLFMMIGTLIAAYIHNGVSYFGSDDNTYTPGGPANDVPLADFRNIVTIFQVCIFSTAFQFAAPGIADQYSDKIIKPKKVLKIGVSYTFATNLVLAMMASVFFGRYNTEESNNLNWLDYHGNTLDGDGEVARWASFISSYIVLFVAIDGLAVFPLIALSLGDILLSAFYGEEADKQGWKVQTAFRLAGSVPQLIIAMFVHDLGAISKYAAVFTLLSYTTCPALLYLQCRKIMPRATFYIPNHAKMKMWFMAWFLIVFSIVLIIGLIVDTIL